MWTAVCLTDKLGLFAFPIPVEPVMALIVRIRLVVSAQNFEITDGWPPAVVGKPATVQVKCVVMGLKPVSGP